MSLLRVIRKSAVLGGRAGPGRAPRTWAGLRSSGRARAEHHGPAGHHGLRRAGGFRPQPAPRSQSHAWTGPHSPLIPGSREGQAHGTLPRSSPSRRAALKISSLFRSCTALEQPGSRLRGRGAGAGPGKGLAARVPLTGPGTAIGTGRFSFSLFDANSGPDPLSLQSQRHLRAAQPGPAQLFESRGCRTRPSNAMSVTRDIRNPRLYTRAHPCRTF